MYIIDLIYVSIIICIFAIIVYFLPKILQHNIYGAKKIKSAVDGEIYMVHDMKDPTLTAESANMMAILNSKVTELLRHLKYKYPKDSKVQNLLKRYNPDNLVENLPNNWFGDTSYSIGKGSLVAMCLKEKSNTLHSEQIVMFVMIHELAHLAIDDLYHPRSFWKAFKFLLKESEEIGIYQNIDYMIQPTTYCGVKVNYNPVFDSALDDN